ncbi:hypothetical protein [Pseudomonas sp. TE24901]
MKFKPSLSIIQGLLFTYCTENFHDPVKEALITSINVNDEQELTELFDELTKPEFLLYTEPDQEWFISSIEHFLSADNTFDAVFKTMATYFSEPVIDQKKFMQTLLSRLRIYKCLSAKN